MDLLVRGKLMTAGPVSLGRSLLLVIVMIVLVFLERRSLEDLFVAGAFLARERDG